jgi:hypothetical protein
MALKTKFIHQGLGVTFDDAYAYITNVQYLPDTKTMNVHVSVLAAAEARQKQKKLAEMHFHAHKAGNASQNAENAYHEASTKLDTITQIANDTEGKSKDEIQKDIDQVIAAQAKQHEALAALANAQKEHKLAREALPTDPSPNSVSNPVFTFPYDEAKVKELGLMGFAYLCLKNARDVGETTDC